MARLLMEDAEWAFFEPFIVGICVRGGRPARNHRLVLDGVFWIARTGAPRTGAQWRDLPDEFGKWSSVYRQFRRWTLAGLWELILEVLNESQAVPDTVQMIDSTVIRAHHQAAGSPYLIVGPSPLPRPATHGHVSSRVAGWESGLGSTTGRTASGHQAAACLDC